MKQWQLIILCLGLISLGCSLMTSPQQAPQQTPMTDEQIIQKYFGNEAQGSLDGQGRVISITCPRFQGLIESEVRGLLRLYLDCPVNKTFPPELGQLTELKFLWLRGTSLTTLPPEVGNLIKLEVLKIEGELTNTEILGIKSQQ